MPHDCIVVSQMIQDNLWSLYPPAPATEEELALELRQKEMQQLEKAREKV